MILKHNYSLDTCSQSNDTPSDASRHRIMVGTIVSQPKGRGFNSWPFSFFLSKTSISKVFDAIENFTDINRAETGYKLE